MGRFARSWALVKASAAVLRSDRKLMVFPLLSTLALIIVAASFLVPLAFSGVLQDVEGDAAPAWAWPLLFVFYLVQYFVIFFFNAALVAAARIRLDGAAPGVRDALRIAAAHWRPILGYAAIAATVGLVLRAIQERVGFLGRWIAGLLGLAWTVATFLVVPVLVNENLGPVDAIRRSTEHLRRTWGENLIGNGGLGLVFGLVIMIWAMAGVAAVIALAVTGHAALAVATAVLATAGLMLLVLVQSALQGIYAAALHRYAETGDAGLGFGNELAADAFRLKA
ncbi:MAG: hypothetical protein J0H15_10115 [Xanthomonadales bacterium]|nr:hypothetical protein [Xanthomonadales bacterium]